VAQLLHVAASPAKPHLVCIVIFQQLIIIIIIVL
jgi:hypothetical protein